MGILNKFYLMIIEVFERLFALLEFFLFLRLMLKYLGANPKSLFVNLIYKYTDTFVSPFRFIFPNLYWPEGRLIEIDTIAAMIGYAIIVFVIFQLLRPFSSRREYVP